MKNIRDFLSENFQFLEEKFSIYLNRRVFVMVCPGNLQYLLQTGVIIYTLYPAVVYSTDVVPVLVLLFVTL